MSAWRCVHSGSELKTNIKETRAYCVKASRCHIALIFFFQLSEINKKAEEEMKRNLREGIQTMLLQSAGLATGLTIMYLFAQYGSLISF